MKVTKRANINTSRNSSKSRKSRASQRNETLQPHELEPLNLTARNVLTKRSVRAGTVNL